LKAYCAPLGDKANEQYFYKFRLLTEGDVNDMTE